MTAETCHKKTALQAHKPQKVLSENEWSLDFIFEQKSDVMDHRMHVVYILL